MCSPAGGRGSATTHHHPQAGAVLARHCEDVGRPVDQIEKTVSTRLAPGESPGSFTDRCAALAPPGIEHVVVITTGPWADDGLACLAAAVPAVERIRPARHRADPYGEQVTPT